MWWCYHEWPYVEAVFTPAAKLGRRTGCRGSPYLLLIVRYFKYSGYGWRQGGCQIESNKPTAVSAILLVRGASPGLASLHFKQPVGWELIVYLLFRVSGVS